jgi:arylsulfatase A-like enzyme
MPVFAAALWLSVTIGWTAERPNVVVILTDDQGWGDLSINGNTNLQTPHIDSLGRDGALFERFFVCPVCSPTRAEFLTGRYHPRGGVWSTSTGGERLDLDEMTIAQTFKAAGYATGAFGKWHNGTQYPYHPNARGFDEYYGFCSGHWGDYFAPPLEHNGRLVKGQGYITDDFTNHAIQFISDHRQQPFFCYLPLNTPHSPMQVPDSFYDKFRDAEIPLRTDQRNKEDLEMTRAALAMCENIDWNVGRLLSKLDELKLAENTIVLYFCDNGPNSFRFNGGMKGRKGSTDEGGVRSPLLVRWPARIKPGTKITQIAGAIDLLPTLAELSGVPVASKLALDGKSVAPLLTGQTREWPDRLLFSHWGGKVSVRTQQYRLDAAGKLFYMLADPGQLRDVSSAHPGVAARLRTAADRWSQELLPGLRDDQRPFPVGYAAFPTTLLPARDGVPHGNVRRSARAPNCSFFTHWTSADDRITWDIEVATSGRYEAVIYYTCPADDIGSTVELAFQDSRLRGKVSQPHDPPAYGDNHDRASRGSESLVKDFQPLSLGIITLAQGRGELTLRALDVPGKQVMEMRLVSLRLLTD